MNKILIINSGLKHSQSYIEPYLKRLEVYLKEENTIVDVRNIMTFDERTIFAYDQIVFLFLITIDTIPSSTLEIFSKLENQKMGNQKIYSVIICDEYETEKCDISEKIMKKWSEKKGLEYQGSLKLSSGLLLMKSIQKYSVCSLLKKAAKDIAGGHHLDIKTSLMTLKVFMKRGNQYWIKEMNKKRKEMKKMSS